MSEGNFGPKR